MRLIDSWKIGGKLRIRLICAGLLGAACTSHAQTLPAPISVAAEAGENHLRNIRQLTNGGENAEAYFSHNGKWLIFQSTRDGRTCDQRIIAINRDPLIRDRDDDLERAIRNILGLIFLLQCGLGVPVPVNCAGVDGVDPEPLLDSDAGLVLGENPPGGV